MKLLSNNEKEIIFSSYGILLGLFLALIMVLSHLSIDTDEVLFPVFVCLKQFILIYSIVLFVYSLYKKYFIALVCIVAIMFFSQTSWSILSYLTGYIDAMS